MKANVTISKGATVNIGNYNTVKPEINITITDVELHNIDKVTELVSELTQDLWIREFANLYGEVATINDITPLNYYKEILKSDIEIKKEISKNWSKIKKISNLE